MNRAGASVYIAALPRSPERGPLKRVEHDGADVGSTNFRAHRSAAPLKLDDRAGGEVRQHTSALTGARPHRSFGRTRITGARAEASPTRENSSGRTIVLGDPLPGETGNSHNNGQVENSAIEQAKRAALKSITFNSWRRVRSLTRARLSRSVHTNKGYRHLRCHGRLEMVSWFANLRGFVTPLLFSQGDGAFPCLSADRIKAKSSLLRKFQSTLPSEATN